MRKPLLDDTDAEFDQVHDLDLTGTFRVPAPSARR